MRLAVDRPMEISNDCDAIDAGPTAAGTVRTKISKRKAYKQVKYTGCFREPEDSSLSALNPQPITLNCLGILDTSVERRALYLFHEDTAGTSGTSLRHCNAFDCISTSTPATNTTFPTNTHSRSLSQSRAEKPQSASISSHHDSACAP